MKFKGKFLFILLIIYFISVSLITLAREPKGKSSKAENINEATIKDSESTIASTSFNNLPSDEVINTFYADPLSDDFMGKTDSKLNAERNRSTSDLLSEFEGQAKIINDNTEIPDEIIDEHSKEDRERIEARADELLKEADIKKSKDNTGESLIDKDNKVLGEDVENKIANNDSSKEEILYSENNVDGDKNKNEFWSSSEEDPEFSSTNVHQESISSNTEEPNKDVEIIEEKEKIETNADDSEEIPNYAEMQGIITAENEEIAIIKEKNIEKKNKKNKKEKKQKRNDKKLKEFLIPLDPYFITDANPKSADDENEKVYTFNGMLIPEKQPLKRNKHMLRWVLRLNDGTRIPLKSNLKLLQEVRKEKNLEDYVSISGKMKTSGFGDNLRYLVPDTIVKAKMKLSDYSKKDSDSDKKDETKDKSEIIVDNNEEKALENISDEIKTDDKDIAKEVKEETKLAENKGEELINNNDKRKN